MTIGGGEMTVRRDRGFSRLCLVLAELFVVITAGCAVHRYDPRTGTENLWGVGHLQMKVSQPDEGVRCVVTGTETVGLGVGLGMESFSLTTGWERRRRLAVVNENTSIRLEWPSADFFTVRAGSAPPLPSIVGTPGAYQEGK